MARRPFEPTGTTISFTPDGGSVFVLNYVEVTPPPFDGGDAIDTVVLATTKWKTKIAPTLIDVGNIQFTAEYQPGITIAAPFNTEGAITITIPGEGQLVVRGYLKSLTPDSMKVGERATCSGEFVVTNTAADGYTETAPVWTNDNAVVDLFTLGNLTEEDLQTLKTALSITSAETGAALLLLIQAAIVDARA